MMNNSLLNFDIDYDILNDIQTDILYEYNMMPLYKEQLFVIVATSNKQNDIDKLVDIFNQPVKLIYVEHCELQFEWKSLSLKRKTFPFKL